jgi:hypothetical protein
MKNTKMKGVKNKHVLLSPRRKGKNGTEIVF